MKKEAKSSVKSGKTINLSSYALACGIISFVFPASFLIALIPGLSVFSTLTLLTFLGAGLVGPLILGIISLRLLKYLPESESNTKKVRWARILAILGIVLNALLLILLLVLIVNGVSMLSRCTEDPSLPECAPLAQLLSAQNGATA